MHPTIVAQCNPPCLNGGKCKPGQYCECPLEWFSRDCSKDFNECLNYRGICGRSRPRAKCKNLLGTYECICRRGYEYDTGVKKCVDFDECLNGTHRCDYNCSNTIGSYECSCPNGYDLAPNGRQCNDINECLNNNGQCTHICINTNGSFHCSCPPGFKLKPNGFACDNVDECILRIHNCSDDRDCVDLMGGFVCQCHNEGYELADDGVTCIDIDECQAGYTGCHQGCINTPGSYECICSDGFKRDDNSQNCSDIDECLTSTHGCNQLCNNTYGSYKCNCMENFILKEDYRTCEAIPCVDLVSPASDILMSNCSVNNFTGVVGSVCQFSCDAPGYELEGSAFRQCLADRTWSGTVTSCARMKCPAILIQHSAVHPSCTHEFNNTCLVHCLPGYSLSDPDAVSGISEITCELNDDASITQWNKDLMCIEDTPCTPNICKNGGKCVLDFEGQPECNCSDTGYFGSHCQFGFVSFPEFPILKVNSPYHFILKARPVEFLKIELVVPSDLSINPNTGIFNSSMYSVAFMLTGKCRGLYTMLFNVDGSYIDLNAFHQPEERAILVIDHDPTLESEPDYSERQNIAPGVLEPGCCLNKGMLTCAGHNNKIKFTSTCSWKYSRGVSSTPGIVFVTTEGIFLPLSFSRISISKSFGNFVFSLPQHDTELTCYTCSELLLESYNASSKPCYCYKPTTKDIVDFLNHEALAVTFFDKLGPHIPAWLNFSISGSNRTHSTNSQMARVVTQLDVNGQDCMRFPTSTTGQYLLLQYNGNLAIQVHRSEIFIPNSENEGICIAVDLCTNQVRPVLYFSLPTGVINARNLGDLGNSFLAAGWDFDVEGIALSPSRQLISESYHAILKGSMVIRSSISNLEMIVSFLGECSLVFESYNEVFSFGLSQDTSGILNGRLTLTLSETPKNNYRLSGRGGSVVHFTMQDINTTCNRRTLQGELTDNLYTRGTSTLSSILEIPPDLRHGDRYQFDCNLNFSAYTDKAAVVTGLVLTSDCHYIRLGRLLLKDFSHTISFGSQASLVCNANIPDELQGYPVLIESLSSSALANIGHFLKLKDLHCMIGLNPSTKEYLAVLRNVQVMLMGSTFTTSIRIHTHSLEMTSVADVYNYYPFLLEVSAQTDQEWDHLVFELFGTATRNDTINLYRDLEIGVSNVLQRIAIQAKERINVTERDVERISSVVTNLLNEKNKTNRLVEEVNLGIEQTIRKIEMLENQAATLKNKITTLGEAADAILLSLEMACSYAECNYTCAPGIINSTCTHIINEEIKGMCKRKYINFEMRNVQLAVNYIPCEIWEGQDFCTCKYGGVTGCRCDISITQWNQHGSVATCKVVEYATVLVQVEEERLESCTVGLKPVKSTLPCLVNSTCSKFVPEIQCLLMNNECTKVRNNMSLQADMQENAATATIMQLQTVQRQLAGEMLNLEVLESKLESAESKIAQLDQACDQLLQGLNTHNLKGIRDENRAGIELANVINKEMVNIDNITFSTILQKESPETVLLVVTATALVPQEKTFTLSVQFNFRNRERSLSEASIILARKIENIILPSSSSRKRRQIIDSLLENGTQTLQNQCADLHNIDSFYKSLHESLVSLEYARFEFEMHVSEVVEFFEFGTQINQRNVSVDPELEAVNELYETLKNGVMESANLTYSNLYVIWQAERNSVINSTGTVFDHEHCLSLSDCYLLSVEVLEAIFISTPSEIGSTFLSKLQLIRRDLDELSQHSNFTILQASERLSSVLFLLSDALDVNYWCANIPEMVKVPETNITVIENAVINLECTARSDSNFPLLYKWRKDGIVLPISNVSILVLNTTLADTGFYECEVSNHVGSTKGLWTFLQVLRAPTFYLEPDNQTRIEGDLLSAQFQCNATSLPNPQFRWYFRGQYEKNFSIIPNRVGNEYHIENPQHHHEGWYKCEAWNEGGSVTSRPAYLAVVRFSISLLLIPVTISMELCNSSSNTSETFSVQLEKQIVEALANVSEEISQPLLSTATVNFRQKSVRISFYLISRNVTLENLLPEEVNTVTNNITFYRQALIEAAPKLRRKLVIPSFYSSLGISVCSVIDESRYEYMFMCSTGKKLDQNTFVLCTNCPPGSYQNTTLMKMKDERGIDFEVSMPTCEMCPPGTYQPQEGKDECIRCDTGVSEVQGAITDEFCIPAKL